MSQNKKSSSRRAQRARERVAAMRRAEARRRRRNRLVAVIAAVVGVAVVVVAVAVGVSASRPDDRPVAGQGGSGAEPPPWPAPVDPAEGVEAAGLDLGPMGTAEHYHAHLDVIISGEPSPVPANIGVDPRTGEMSALHTHTPDGVIHVEADRVGEPFTLGQLFTQWGVRLSPDQLGSLTATDSQPLSAFVNGEKYIGDPSAIRLADQQQIAVVFGEIEASNVPSTYDFENV